MKLGACIISYREGDRLTRCVEQLLNVADRIMVLESEKPWNGEATPLDGSLEKAEELGADVVVGSWNTEEEQRNAGQVLLSDMDWILIVDADEYYSSDSLYNVVQFLETASLPAYGISKIETYWKTPQWRIDPPESGGLIVAVRPEVRFTHLRCIDSPWGFLPDTVVMRHHSYVRTDEEVRRKVESFGHAAELVPNWYEEKWLGWDSNHNLEDLHPVHPTSFKRAFLCA